MDIYSFNISSELQRSTELFKNLNADEVLKANRFHFKKDRGCYIICRGILRELLSTYLYIDPHQIFFEYNTYGKPEITLKQNKNNINFNLSHSGNYCVIAISNIRNVGVDIEEVKYLEDLISISQSFFSEYEICLLQNELCKVKQLHLFYSIWTQKESLVKSSGKGLSFGLDHWSIEDGQEDYAITINNQDYLMNNFTVDENYLSCLCIYGYVLANTA